METKIKSLKSKYHSIITQQLKTLFLVSAFAVGLLFFLSSRLWLPAAGTIEETPIGTVMNYGSTDITFKSARLSADRKYLLINVGTNDKNVDKVANYNIGANGVSGEAIKGVQVIYRGMDFFVVKIPNIRFAKGVELGIEISEVDVNATTKNANSSVMYIGVLLEGMQTDKTTKETYTSAEMELYNMQDDYDLINLKINTTKSEVSTNENIIKTAEEKILYLQDSTQYKTNEEKAEIKEQISSLKANIQNTVLKNEELDSDITMLHNNLLDKQNKIEEYKIANDLP